MISAQTLSRLSRGKAATHIRIMLWRIEDAARAFKISVANKMRRRHSGRLSEATGIFPALPTRGSSFRFSICLR
jgi:hypothetical protein